jgi:hypothetical protein
MAIRVAFFNGKLGARYAEFDVVPVERPDQYRCIPPDLLSFAVARHVSEELSEGRIDGWAERYRWYRQVGGSAGSRQAR